MADDTAYAKLYGLLEPHSSAWNRMYNYRKRWKPHWQSEGLCPIRMRGYTELVLGNLDMKLRKKLDTALKRGYALEINTQLPLLLRMVIDHCPVARVPIGYVGKTFLDLYIPTIEEAKDMCDELNALAVLTDSFKGRQLRYYQGYGWQNYARITANTLRKGVNPQLETAQLVSAFTELRPAIGQWMEKDAANREQMAHWCADDASVIRIPFDSHKDR